MRGEKVGERKKRKKIGLTLTEKRHVTEEGELREKNKQRERVKEG